MLVNMIASFNHIVFVKCPNVRNVQPGTIYIDALGHTAIWQCPCGCGNIAKVKIRKCKVFDPYDSFSVPSDEVGYELSDDGEFSTAPLFVDPKCPNGLVYGIEHNKVIIHQTNL